ncbi:hypothetical protein MA05_08560 [Comamonas aquatica]|uniref:methyl-accepting chemotaxis protein n=1 Tax=Comamonas aquatica TaxID=225991 RepID=UPI000698F166|nr:MCP four helix bundle domain-containing protein [Comamonas aquatica]ANY62133.1 hypothetical protein MA05_08560 [Comamonas aquatica]
MGLNNLKIGRRLALSFGLVLLITATIAGLGIWRLQTLGQAMDRLTREDSQRLQATNEWRQGIELNWMRTRAAILSPDAHHFAELQKEMAETSKSVDQLRTTIEGLIRTEAGRQLVVNIDKARAAYRDPRAELLKRRAAGEDVSAALDQQLVPLAEAYNQSIRQFEQRQQMLYEQTRDATMAQVHQSQWIILVCAAIALLTGGVAAWLLSRSVTGPLQLAVRSAEQIAEGDLTQSIAVQGRDETAALLGALQHMQTRLAEVVSGVRSNAESVATASAQIAQGNSDLSSRTESQASALEETAASMEQLGTTVRQNADNAKRPGGCRVRRRECHAPCARGTRSGATAPAAAPPWRPRPCPAGPRPAGSRQSPHPADRTARPRPVAGAWPPHWPCSAPSAAPARHRCRCPGRRPSRASTAHGRRPECPGRCA